MTYEVDESRLPVQVFQNWNPPKLTFVDMGRIGTTKYRHLSPLWGKELNSRKLRELLTAGRKENGSV